MRSERIIKRDLWRLGFIIVQWNHYNYETGEFVLRKYLEEK